MHVRCGAAFGGENRTVPTPALWPTAPAAQESRAGSGKNKSACLHQLILGALHKRLHLGVT